MKIVFYFLPIFLFTSFMKSDDVDSPNIIVFLVDDMGWQDTSVPFWDKVTDLNRRYHTPNMEKLARKGMKFTNAYSHAVCSPTRVSLMTGMNPAHHHVTNWTLRKNKKSDAFSDSIQTPDWNMNGLSPIRDVERTIHATPLPQILHDHGYFTIHSGKAHLGAIGTPASDPRSLGFDVNIAGHAAGAPASYQGKDNYGHDEEGNPKNVWSVPGLEKYHGTNTNLTEALTIEAIQALKDRPKNKPFFLYMAHYGVHIPIQPDHRFYKKYLENGLDTIEARYASMVESMDESLGKIMTYLEKETLSENTIILFMSDNGGLSVSARGGIPNTHNYPLSSGKGSALEGGVREPMIVSWPGKIAQGATNKLPLIIEDFFPTILDVAGISNPEVIQDTDGVSFYTALLESYPPIRKRPIIWHMPNIWGPVGPGIGPYSAIRLGRYKYIYYYETGDQALYNLEKDILEKTNLFSEKQQIAIDLRSMLKDHLSAYKAQFPINKSTGKEILIPES